MSPDRPNCLVDISATFEKKMAALSEMRYQLGYTAQSLREKMDYASLEGAIPGLRSATDDAEAGALLLRYTELSHALHYGLAGHSRFGLVEAYRREGPLDLDLLL
jgi:hypothetical protein